MCVFFDTVWKVRQYTVTEVLDEVLARSDSDFDLEIADANDKTLKFDLTLRYETFKLP